MIEIAPTDYWKYLTIDEAIIYCFSLNINGKIGWRLPTKREYYNVSKLPMRCWYQSSNAGSDIIRETAPVRDLTND